MSDLSIGIVILSLVVLCFVLLYMFIKYDMSQTRKQRFAEMSTPMGRKIVNTIIRVYNIPSKYFTYEELFTDIPGHNTTSCQLFRRLKDYNERIEEEKRNQLFLEQLKIA